MYGSDAERGAVVGEPRSHSRSSTRITNAADPSLVYRDVLTAWAMQSERGSSHKPLYSALMTKGIMGSRAPTASVAPIP
jgi:hypothetical protein